MLHKDCAVLIVDDDKDICNIISRALQREQIFSQTVSTVQECLLNIKKKNFNLLILDDILPDGKGTDLLNVLDTEGFIKNNAVIIITAYGTVEQGLFLLQKGCYDYILKPFNIENLILRVHRALEHTVKNKNIISHIESSSFRGIVGESDSIKKVIDMIHKIAQIDISVLIEGETGTGKELVARAIHEESLRNKNLFFPVNCSSIPESLAESELFGYEKGAFTGAINSKEGLLEIANKGTLFLDEINSLPLNIQVKLLRFLDNGEYIRVGGRQVKYTDVRIIAATNQNLEKLVREGKFREDLFFRLNIMKIFLPPLSQRKEDIPILAKHFIKLFNKTYNKSISFHPEVFDFFINYSWPGNVRQLKNIIHYMVITAQSDLCRIEDLPSEIKSDSIICDSTLIPFKKAKQKIIDNFEKDYFSSLLIKYKGNLLKISETIDIDRKYLSTRLKKLGLNPQNFRKRTN